jgi:hypothetical protein
LTDRPLDVSFLVDSMTELDASDPGGRFSGKIDLEHVGLTGHSFGGLTTLLGHFSFSNGCPLGIGTGDGCGTATRANGEVFTFQRLCERPAFRAIFG